jgi:two-component system, OmpR family, phosphate regulon response regulator PhoB
MTVVSISSARSDTKSETFNPNLPGRKKKVLIIEDEDVVRKALSLRLTRLGFHVTAVGDGIVGLQEAKRLIPDLIILDLRLPNLPGEAICAAIREDDNEKIASIPIIMSTAKDGDADRILGKVVGADTYLTKPFEFKVLFDAMVRHI